jgi:hypothetical protein
VEKIDLVPARFTANKDYGHLSVCLSLSLSIPSWWSAIMSSYHPLPTVSSIAVERKGKAKARNMLESSLPLPSPRLATRSFVNLAKMFGLGGTVHDDEVAEYDREDDEEGAEDEDTVDVDTLMWDAQVSITIPRESHALTLSSKEEETMLIYYIDCFNSSSTLSRYLALYESSFTTV